MNLEKNTKRILTLNIYWIIIIFVLLSSISFIYPPTRILGIIFSIISIIYLIFLFIMKNKFKKLSKDEKISK